MLTQLRHAAGDGGLGRLAGLVLGHFDKPSRYASAGSSNDNEGGCTKDEAALPPSPEQRGLCCCGAATPSYPDRGLI